MENLTQKRINENIIPLIEEYNKALMAEAVVELKTNALLGSFSERLKYIYSQTQAAISAEMLNIQMEVQSYFTTRTVLSTVTRFVNRINVVDKRNVEGDIERASGVKASKIKGLRPLQDRGTDEIVKRSINENVSLIKSIPSEYLKRVEESVYTGLGEGRSTASIGREISEIGGVTERRGQFIARDQLGSVYGNLTAKRQENLGLKKFRWVTSEDERVRDSHRVINGMIFDLETGAYGPKVPAEVVGLMPGEDYNCRCTSSIVEEDVFDLLDRLERGEG